jgi:hypothetical protein
MGHQRFAAKAAPRIATGLDERDPYPLAGQEQGETDTGGTGTDDQTVGLVSDGISGGVRGRFRGDGSGRIQQGRFPG